MAIIGLSTNQQCSYLDGLFWLDVETWWKLDNDIVMMRIYNNYSEKSVLHVYMTSCMGYDCFVDYGYCFFMIMCGWKNVSILTNYGMTKRCSLE